MSRIPPLTPDAMSADQKRIHDIIASGPRGRVRGPLAVWLHRPGLAEPAQALGAYCRYGTSLSPRLSEWAITVIARHWESKFEWWSHSALAMKAGVSRAMIDALRDGREVPYDNPDESLVHRFLTVLHETKRIPDELYDEAVLALGEAGVIDLTGLAGYYSLVSMTLNVFDVPLPEGETTDLKTGSDASSTKGAA